MLFLDTGFNDAIEVYRKKYNNLSTPEESLKNANWDVVEFQTLLQQAQNLKQAYEEELSYLNPAMVTPQVLRRVKGSVRGMATEAKAYLRNLFKKRRTAATHVLVLMLSDERRQKKPYALPVRFVPYRTLRDQYVRDFTRQVKQKMTERGLHLVGEWYHFSAISLWTEMFEHKHVNLLTELSAMLSFMEMLLDLLANYSLKAYLNT